MPRTARLFILPALACAAALGASPVSALAAAECGDGVRADGARVQLWKEAGCSGSWIEAAFGEDGDRPDFRRFRHADGDDYDVDDNRASAVIAEGHCARFFSDPGYRGHATRLLCARRADRTAGLPEGISSMRVCPLEARTLCRRRAVSPARPNIAGGRHIEPFDFDLPGRYPTACSGRVLPGTRALARVIERRWYSGSLRLDYACVQLRPGVVDVHGEGRALDWALDSRLPHDRAIGDALVRWLLADDRHGNRHARARRMGVQEIAWNGRIWTSKRWSAGLRPIRGTQKRRRWVHIALTHEGARGRTSFWRG